MSRTMERCPKEDHALDIMRDDRRVVTRCSSIANDECLNGYARLNNLHYQVLQTTHLCADKPPKTMRNKDDWTLKLIGS